MLAVGNFFIIVMFSSISHSSNHLRAFREFSENQTPENTRILRIANFRLTIVTWSIFLVAAFILTFVEIVMVKGLRQSYLMIVAEGRLLSENGK